MPPVFYVMSVGYSSALTVHRFRGAFALILFGALLLVGCSTSSNVYAPIGDRTLPPSRSAGIHVVQRGDTLFSVAWQHGLDYQTVAAWNRIRPPYTIYPGQRIQLRAPADKNPSESGARPSTHGSSRMATSDTPGRTAPARPPVSTLRIHTPPAAPAKPLSNGPVRWQWPASGPILRSFDGDSSGKKGISIGGTHGSLVRSSAGGRVVYAGSGLVGYGRLIIIQHNDTYLSAYGHNRNLLVKEGDEVRAGQVIAHMGSSGTNRIQLHFEIRQKGKPVDPLQYLPRR